MLQRFFFLILIGLFVSLSRLIPHPPNFSPMLALALFCGAVAPSRWLACLIPVAALWFGDLIIGTHDLMWVTGGALLFGVGLGDWVNRLVNNRGSLTKFGGWLGAGLFSSIVFFLITNFAVWSSTAMYPHTSEGLWTCFVMGLPFFHNQVLATWLFTGVLFVFWGWVDQPVLRKAFQRER